ncbi:ATP-binding cassette domain-containing protein, partial [Escherichia coli]|uniref:ATP-binding cassette domain-containing protein n=1 Tax=Escherichia coli TaxID=562 RepID=UPI00227DA1B9
MLLPSVGPDGMSVEEIYTMFPNLKERAHSPGTRLSGGEQQMLAIARILRTGAQLILLDEPLSALDARVRTDRRAEIHEVQRRLQIPTIMVTHDQEE